MKKIVLIIALLSCSAYGQDKPLNCDSTCVVPQAGMVSTPIPKAQTVYGSNTVSMPATTSTQDTKTTYGTCPAGFTYYGSSTYPMSQTTTITYWKNGQVVGTQTMPSQDLDNDCSAVQYQTLQCPAGQTGSIIQVRSVSTGNAGYEYSAWTTTSNSCVASSGVWTWLGWNGGGGSPECNYSVTVNGRSCSPVGYLCLFRDDMTTKKGQYQCR